jgi:hypothetical protein
LTLYELKNEDNNERKILETTKNYSLEVFGERENIVFSFASSKFFFLIFFLNTKYISILFS